MNQQNDLAKGTVGMLATMGSFMASLMPWLETGLRVTSLCVGIAVGVITFMSIYRRWKRGE
jgi:hypothetical protein